MSEGEQILSQIKIVILNDLSKILGELPALPQIELLEHGERLFVTEVFHGCHGVSGPGFKPEVGRASAEVLLTGKPGSYEVTIVSTSVEDLKELRKLVMAKLGIVEGAPDDYDGQREWESGRDSGDEEEDPLSDDDEE